MGALAALVNQDFSPVHVEGLDFSRTQQNDRSASLLAAQMFPLKFWSTCNTTDHLHHSANMQQDAHCI